MMLRFASVRLCLSFDGEVELPRWLGSAFRGGFGQHLRQIVCYHPLRNCEKCESISDCLFYLDYENVRSKRGYSPPPRPVVLVPPFFGKRMEFPNGAKLNLRLLMFGVHARQFPIVILALQQFGSHGIGDARYVGKNRFEVVEARCEFSNNVVFDGRAIYLSRLEMREVSDLPPVEWDRIKVEFRTPIELPLGFPPSPEHFLELIRLRLVRLVNEYGTGERVPKFKCKGEVRALSKQHHILVGYSQRSGRREFWKCWTGVAEYEFEKIDRIGKWLLGVGRILGAGAKASFGCGFFELFPAE